MTFFVITIFTIILKVNMKNKLMLKEDINFLEYPTWIIDEKCSDSVHTIKKEKGTYEIKGADGLPHRFDKIVLYFLLSRLFNSDKAHNREVLITRYELAKNVFYNVKSIGRIHYERVMKSLKKWNGISIKFEGIFYEGDGWSFRLFHVIEDVIFKEEEKKLVIRFNQQYIQQLLESKFYKLIDFQEYKKLQKPVSARLYEILLKNFKDREIWHINIIKLAEKLTWEKRTYPSQILIALRPAIQEINKKTELKIECDYNNETQLCVFRTSVGIPEKVVENFKILTEINEKSPLLTILTTYGISLPKAREFIVNYPESKIKHKLELLKHSTSAIKNVTAWLAKALEEEWDSPAYNKQLEEQRIKEEKALKQKEQEDLKKKVEILKAEFTQYKSAKAREIFDTLPDLLQENLSDQFVMWLKAYGTGPSDEESCRSAFLASILLKKDEQSFEKWLANQGHYTSLITI
jgi:hypothetical protein